MTELEITRKRCRRLERQNRSLRRQLAARNREITAILERLVISKMERRRHKQARLALQQRLQERSYA